MGVPVVLALNMMDVARKRGIRINTEKLAEKLGCPVVPVVATTGEGTAELKARILAVATGAECGGFSLANEEVVEQAVADLEQYLPGENPANRHWLALKMLESDDLIPADFSARARQSVLQWRKMIEDRSGEEPDIHISDSRFMRWRRL